MKYMRAMKSSRALACALVVMMLLALPMVARGAELTLTKTDSTSATAGQPDDESTLVLGENVYSAADTVITVDGAGGANRVILSSMTNPSFATAIDGVDGLIVSSMPYDGGAQARQENEFSKLFFQYYKGINKSPLHIILVNSNNFSFEARDGASVALSAYNSELSGIQFGTGVSYASIDENCRYFGTGIQYDNIIPYISSGNPNAVESAVALDIGESYRITTQFSASYISLGGQAQIEYIGGQASVNNLTQMVITTACTAQYYDADNAGTSINLNVGDTVSAFTDTIGSDEIKCVLPNAPAGEYALIPSENLELASGSYAKMIVYNCSDWVSMRQAPLRNSPRLFKVNLNETVDMFGVSGEFYKVRYSEAYGYIPTAYLKPYVETSGGAGTGFGNFTYQSGNEAAATVDAHGVVTMTGAGDAQIFMLYNGEVVDAVSFVSNIDITGGQDIKIIVCKKCVRLVNSENAHLLKCDHYSCDTSFKLGHAALGCGHLACGVSSLNDHALLNCGEHYACEEFEPDTVHEKLPCDKHCKCIVNENDWSLHAAHACGEHGYLCEGEEASAHAALNCGEHYACEESAPDTVHEKLPCGKHCKCIVNENDWSLHAAHTCGEHGYLCEGEAANAHALLDCGEHYACGEFAPDTVHEKLPCGKHCKCIIAQSEWQLHAPLACNKHGYLCEGVDAGAHAILDCGAHYACGEFAPGTVHEKLPCGEHFKCIVAEKEWPLHATFECGAHYLCEDSFADEHVPFPCGAHYICDYTEYNNHTLFECGNHYPCDDSNDDPHFHARFACGEHYACDGLGESENHAVHVCGKHYMCNDPGEHDHVKRACGIHFACDEDDSAEDQHYAYECGIHFLCDEDAENIDHSQCEP